MPTQPAPCRTTRFWKRVRSGLCPSQILTGTLEAPDTTRERHRTTRDWSGVDLNRNYPLTWQSGTTYNGALNNEGSNPLSEPESRAVVGLAESIGPQIYLDVHGHMTTIENGEECAAEPGKAVARTDQDNWKVAIPYVEFTWDSGDDSYERTDTTAYALGTDALHWVWPGKAGGLPELTEATLSGAPSGRYYSPYDESYACDERADHNKGSSRGSYLGQAFGYYYPEFSAVGIRFEALQERVAPATPHVLENPSWWKSTNLEQVVSCDDDPGTDCVAQDLYYALNDLARQASNPVPGPSLGSTTPRHNLVVSRFVAMDGGCNLLRSHTAPQDLERLVPTSRHTTFGTKDLLCRVTNWGNEKSNSFTISMTVTDRTTTTTTTTSALKRGLAGGASTTYSVPYTFERDHDYRVSCSISATGETDAQYLDVIHDQGCIAADGAFEHCVPNGTSWNAEFDTNERSMVVSAVIDPTTVCRDGIALPVNENGLFVAHLPAVVF